MRNELQNEVAGVPTFLSTLKALVTFAQSSARFSRFTAGVGSGQAVASPVTVEARKSLIATITSDVFGEMVRISVGVRIRRKAPRCKSFIHLYQIRRL